MLLIMLILFIACMIVMNEFGTSAMSQKDVHNMHKHMIEFVVAIYLMYEAIDTLKITKVLTSYTKHYSLFDVFQ